MSFGAKTASQYRDPVTSCSRLPAPKSLGLQSAIFSVCVRRRSLCEIELVSADEVRATSRNPHANVIASPFFTCPDSLFCCRLTPVISGCFRTGSFTVCISVKNCVQCPITISRVKVVQHGCQWPGQAQSLIPATMSNEKHQGTVRLN